MTKTVLGLLATDEAVLEAVDKAGKQLPEGGKWRLMQFNSMSHRLVPAPGLLARPGMEAAAAQTADGGLVRQLLHRYGLARESARYFAQGLRQGGFVVTIETSDELAGEARRLLNSAGAQGVTLAHTRG